MIKKLFNFSHTRNGTFLRVCGLWLALNPWGNCFSPALIVDARSRRSKPFCDRSGVTRYPAKVIFIVRTGITETKVFWRGGLRFDWNSAHLARRFGKFTETDFGGIFQWGKHVDL